MIETLDDEKAVLGVDKDGRALDASSVRRELPPIKISNRADSNMSAVTPLNKANTRNSQSVFHTNASSRIEKQTLTGGGSGSLQEKFHVANKRSSMHLTTRNELKLLQQVAASSTDASRRQL